VEDLGSKLKPDPFIDVEILEGREVHSVEARSLKLRGRAPQSCCTGEWDAGITVAQSCRRGNKTGSQHARLRKCGRVIEVRNRAVIRMASGEDDCVACGSGRSVAGAGNVHRLPSLESAAPNHSPAASDRICGPSAGIHKVLTFAKRQLVGSTEVDDITD